MTGAFLSSSLALSPGAGSLGAGVLAGGRGALPWATASGLAAPSRSMATNADTTRSLISSATHSNRRRPSGAWRPTPTRRDLSSAPPPTQTGGAPQEHGDQRRRDEISHQLRRPDESPSPREASLPAGRGGRILGALDSPGLESLGPPKVALTRPRTNAISSDGRASRPNPVTTPPPL